ncbi:hypothetical protein T459_31017 [Capsicum annuum]|uniref:Disease resistance protein At3g14460 n=1 Tax=Capsicum annuum TaxID=4072 RepID=A0A2G2YA22_CAPAN|nr:hypothetical protein T459_31017 [Capsicum annuum]
MHGIIEVIEEFWGNSLHFNSLEKLEFSKMLEWKQWHVLDQCDSISPEFELVPRACDLRVDDCQSLTSLLILAGTENVRIFGCGNLEILSVAWVTQIMALRGLSIGNCEKLKSLPEKMQELLPSLNELYLTCCPEIESFPEGGLPFNLQDLGSTIAGNL